jgi:hypothetical protein
MKRSHFGWLFGAGVCVAVGAVSLRAWPWGQKDIATIAPAGGQLSEAGALVEPIMASAAAHPDGLLATLLRGKIAAPSDMTGAKPACVWFMASTFGPLGTGATAAPDRISAPAIILTAELLSAAHEDPTISGQIDATLNAWPQGATEVIELPVRMFRIDEKAIYHAGDVTAVIATQGGIGMDAGSILPKPGKNANKLTWYLCTKDPAPGDNSPSAAPPGGDPWVEQAAAQGAPYKYGPWTPLTDVAPKPMWDASTQFPAQTLVQTPEPGSPAPQLWASLKDNHGIDPRTDDGTHWRAITHAVRMLLDGFGNPIVLVPTGGLATIHSEHLPTYDYAHPYRPGDQVIYKPTGRKYFWEEYWTCIAAPPTPGVPPIVERNWFRGVQAPGATCFWASAGVDGDFQSGDENEYVFGK